MAGGGSQLAEAIIRAPAIRKFAIGQLVKKKKKTSVST